jgi:hypothetical protein
MKFTYELTEDDGRWIAECVESDAVGEGKTVDDAIASLRRSLEERLFRPDAVAPPPVTKHAPIELVAAPERAARKSLDLGGPGEPSPR